MCWYVRNIVVYTIWNMKQSSQSTCSYNIIITQCIYTYIYNYVYICYVTKSDGKVITQVGMICNFYGFWPTLYIVYTHKPYNMPHNIAMSWSKRSLHCVINYSYRSFVNSVSHEHLYDIRVIITSYTIPGMSQHMLIIYYYTCIL